MRSKCQYWLIREETRWAVLESTYPSQPKILCSCWFREGMGEQLQPQSKLLGHFCVSLSPPCWCTRFGDWTTINNFERDKGSTRRQKNSIWSKVSQLFLSETVVTQNLILTFLLTIISRQSAALILSASSSSNRHSICRMIQFCVYSTANFTQSRYPVSVSSVCSARRRWTEAWDTDKK